MNRYLLHLSVPLLALALAGCGDSAPEGPVDDAGASGDTTDSQGEAGEDTGDASGGDRAWRTSTPSRRPREAASASA